MGTPLNTGSGSSGPPSIKLPNIGDAVRFAVIDVNPNIVATVFGKNEPKLDKFGRAKKATALTVLILGGGKHGDTQTGYTDAEPDTVGTIYIESYTKYDPDRDRLGGTHLSFGGACDALEGGLQVGDVGEWKYLENLPSKGAEPRKDRKFRFRHPKDDEGAQTARCEQLRAELVGNVLVASGGSAPGPFDDDEF
jgi:hypothetical protein